MVIAYLFPHTLLYLLLVSTLFGCQTFKQNRIHSIGDYRLVEDKVCLTGEMMYIRDVGEVRNGVADIEYLLSIKNCEIYIPVCSVQNYQGPATGWIEMQQIPGSHCVDVKAPLNTEYYKKFDLRETTGDNGRT